jgi:hypothetical protein
MKPKNSKWIKIKFSLGGSNPSRATRNPTVKPLAIGNLRKCSRALTAMVDTGKTEGYG